MTFSKSLGVAATLLLASPALAGSTDTPVFPMAQVTPAAISVAPAAANNWSGFYAGGMASFDRPEILLVSASGNPPIGINLTDNTSFGGFAGYNFQGGAFVYGAEFAGSSGGVARDGFPDNIFSTVYDLKARVGYSLGNVLAYGVVGGSFTSFDAGAQGDVAMSGFSYGVGLDYRIGDHFFIGAEHLVRDLSGNSPIVSENAYSTTIQSNQIRVGWKF